MPRIPRVASDKSVPSCARELTRWSWRDQSGRARLSSLVATLAVFLVLASGFALVRASAGERFPWPESLSRIFGSRSARTVSPAPVAAVYTLPFLNETRLNLHRPLMRYLDPLMPSFGTCDTAGPVEVEATGGTLGPTAYTNLGNALLAIGSGTHTGVITIDICGDTTENAGGVSLGGSGGSASYTSITISPAGGAARTLTGNTGANTMFLMNGADNVTIDGLNTGGNSLTITNTSTSGVSNAVFMFQNDATNNTIKNCTILGSSTSATIGTIAFATTSLTTGNDNNVIDSNNIGPAGSNLPFNGIYSAGNTGSTTLNNSGIQITNNKVYDFFSAASPSMGIDLASGNNTWTISNNRIYQTATRSYTTGNTHRGIFIGSGSGYTVTGNTIGYAAANGTGTYTMTGAVATTFAAIELAVGTGGTTSVQNNTVANFSLTTASTSSSFPGVFSGIYVSSGNVNVGTATGNTIGAGSGTGSITVTASNNNGTVWGIASNSSNTVSISNNTIGSITTAGTTASVLNTIIGIHVNSGTATISNNTVGSTTTANSLNVSNAANTATANGESLFGILSAASLSSTITNNTIANLNNAYAGTNTAGLTFGIFTTSGSHTITGNTVRNISGAAAHNGGGSGTVVGISASSNSQPLTVSQNVVHTITCNSTGGTVVTGIYYSGPASGTNVISRNYVHSLNNQAIAGSTLQGISVASGPVTVQNNMVRLGIDANGNSITSSLFMRGIIKASGVSSNFYFNSVFVGGTSVVSGTGTSQAFFRAGAPSSGTDDIRDNIFVNARSNATGGGSKHYAYQLQTSTSSLTSDYNLYYVSGTDGILGNTAGTDRTTLAGIQTGTGQDTHSLNFDPLFLVPNGTSATVDLHVNNSSPASNAGITIAGVTNDFDNDTRSNPPDIGADEFLSPGTIQFSSATYSDSETNATHNKTITVTRSGGSDGAVSVHFTTNDNTANAGSDYTAISGDFTWTNGDTSARTFNVSVTGDTIFESDETVNLVLSAPGGGATLGSPNTAVLTITNDDSANGTIQFSSATYGDSETNATHNKTITVTRASGSYGAISVHYATTDGSATAGSDYTATSGDLNWADGDLAAKTFDISVTGDTSFEPDETVNIALSSPTGGASLGSPNTSVLTITNDDTCASFSTVYVDDNWTGTAIGADPDGVGPANYFGCDSFATIQEGVNGVAAGGTVIVNPGTYNEDVVVNNGAGLQLLGAGAGTTNIAGPIGGPSTTVQILANNVTVAGFTITRAGNNTTDWNNPNLNTAGIAIQGQAITGAVIRDNILNGNRTGIDINNSNSHTIRNNVIDFNRTGMIFRNQTDNMTVVENFITNNWTVGILFLDGSGGTNSPVQSAIGSAFSNNNLSGNWYGQIVDRQSGGSLPAPGTTNLKNFSGDWFGTNAPVMTTANSTEPGYAAQIPVAYGGTATPPGGQPDIVGPASANFDYTPYLDIGTDTNVETVPGRGTNGFQGSFNVLQVVADGAQTGSTGRIQEGANSLTSGGTLKIHTGAYTENIDATANSVVLAPGASPGQVTINGNLVLDNNDIVAIEIDGTTAGSGFDQLVVNGTVTLGGASLSLSGTYTPNFGDSFKIVDNDSNDAVTGTFNGLPEGATISNFLGSGLDATITYAGGDGNDVVLTVMTPSFAINNVSQNEGNTGTTTYTFTVTKTWAGAASVQFATADNTAKLSDSDYQSNSGTLNFGPSDTSMPVMVLVNGDTKLEPDETFFVNLSNPTNATISQAQGIGTIQNDDSAPTFSIDSVTQVEGNGPGSTNFVFTVTKTGATGERSRVDFATAAGTTNPATAGGACGSNVDYVSQNGTLIFLPGETSKPVMIAVCGDNRSESAETFFVNLSNAVNASITSGQGTGTITNDDTCSNNTVYVDGSWAGTNFGDDPDGPGPATSFGCDSFGTIQTGINGMVSGGTVIVYAGTYKENPTVNKAVTIQGPNVGVAGSAVRAAEASVVTNGNQNAVFTVTSNNVTIDGFTIDGDDPLITPGGALASGDDANVLYGVRPTGAFNHITVQNNIVKRVAIGFRGDGASQNNLITANWFDSVGNFDFGYCVSLRTDFYADVTNNKMTRAWTGIHINDHHTAGGPANFNLNSNDIHSYAGGILYWLNYNAATGATISGNTITAESGAVANNFGVLIVTLQNAVSATITNNTITGHNYGVGLFNVPTSSTITLGSTNSIVNSSLAGVFLTDNLNFNPIGTTNFLAGGPGAASTVNINGLPITGNTGAGLKVEGTTNQQTLAFGSGTIVSGGTVGLLMTGAQARVYNNNLNNVSFNGQTNYITLANGASAGLEVDGTSVSFDGVTGATATLAENYAIEDQIVHAIDDGTLGFVRVKAGNVFVTPNSFTATTLTPSVQRAIDAASSGDVVNVQAGTYPGGINGTAIGKAITISPGASPAQVTINGNLTLDSNDTLVIEIDGTDPSSQYDNFIVNGTVTLGGATLSLSGTHTPVSGQTFTIISNDASDSVSGTFNGLTEGTLIPNFLGSSLGAKITYAGGSNSNDVILTVVSPEVDVQGNGISIADGDNTPSATDDTDFGTLTIGNSLSHTFTILNTGTAPLNLTGTPKVQITGSTDFVVTTQPSSPVATSGSTTFVVKFTPSAPGAATATISLANDDPDENPYNFDVSGSGFNPCHTLTVNVTSDEPDATPGDGICETATGNGFCTLRAAIMESNALTSCAPLTIDFSLLPGSEPQLIALGSSLEPITRSVTIQGPVGQMVSVDGNQSYRIFEISSATNVTISNLIIQNGSEANNGAGLLNSGSATVNLFNLAFTGNQTDDANGAAIYNASGTLNIWNCTIANNLAQNSGKGGGIYNDSGTVKLTNDTISANGSDTAGGGVYNNAGTVSVRNTIIAGNPSPGWDIFGTFTSQGHNIIGNGDTGTGFTDGVNNDRVGNQTTPFDPLLDLFDDHGGATLTFSLLPNSPAIDGGDDCVLTGCSSTSPLITTDQRSVARPQGAHVDIGAFEFVTYVVNTTADHAPGLCEALPGGDCTLREAINAANGNFFGPSRIAFGIPTDGSDPGCVTGVCTIALNNSQGVLPEINTQVFIDGYTQTGATPNTLDLGDGDNAALKIVLSGTNLGAGAIGLDFCTGANNSTVQGLVVNGFQGVGIQLDDDGSTNVQGNFIGTDVTGMVAVPNGAGIAIVNGFFNFIGGDSPAARNVISGNTGDGLSISGDNTAFASVEGNYIGTRKDGASALANNIGVNLFDFTGGHTIGCETENGDNVISGNTSTGIRMNESAFNLVQGNRIGTDKTGASAVPNGIGVDLCDAPFNAIGGDGFGNLISGNTGAGVRLRSTIDSSDPSSDNVIYGNKIGTNFQGLAAIPNNIGILIQSSDFNDIGSGDAPDRNLVSGNTSYGVRLENSNDVVLWGNRIGTDVTGEAAVPNGAGVSISGGSDNEVGCTFPGSGNVISGNTGDGVQITGSASNNFVQNNLIGVQVDGVSPLANGGVGVEVYIGANGNIIGADSGGGTLASRVFNAKTNSKANAAVAAGGGCSKRGASNSRNTRAFKAAQTQKAKATALVQKSSRSGRTAKTFAAAKAFTGAKVKGTASVNKNGPTPSFVITGANVIANNGEEGVKVSSSGDINNLISQNSIYANGKLGINLVGGAEDGNGVTANDTNDGDTGPNYLQNYPVITSAITDSGVTTINGTLNSNADQDYLIEFFMSSYPAPGKDPSGFGEGQTYLGATLVSTSGNDAAFTFNPSSPVPIGSWITATAIDTSNNTSEFSGAFQVTPAVLPVVTVALAADTTVPEEFGPSLVFRFSRDETSGPLTVNFSIGGTADPNTDYTHSGDASFTPPTGTVVFAAGQATADVTIAPAADNTPEPNETVTLAVASGSGYTIGAPNSATGTIIDNDCPSVFVVNTSSDTAADDANPGDGVCAIAANPAVCSLRAAIQEANALTMCGPITINLTAVDSNFPINLLTPLPAIDHDVQVLGNAGVIVQRDSSASNLRIFDINPARTVQISDLIMSKGSISGSGGVINNQGTLTLTNCTVSEGQATSGGGIYNSGTLNLNNSTLSTNQAANGGGIYNVGTLNLTNVTVGANGANGNGGGIVNDGAGVAVLTNVTVANNRCDNDTNASGAGGGIFIQSGFVRLHNTIVARNFKGGSGTSADDVNGTLDSTSSYNLIGDGTGITNLGSLPGNNQTGTAGSPIDPLLGLLINNGGNTAMYGLLYNSPALDAGDDCVFNNTCSPSLGTSLTLDQRGQSRKADGDLVAGAHVDIGAYERQSTESRIAAAGSNINIDINDARLHFPSVIPSEAASQLKLTTVPVPGDAPAGSGPAFDITPTFTYTGPVDVCFYLPAITSPTAFATLKIYHREAGILVDYGPTTTHDFANKIICTQVNSFSEFVLNQSVGPTATNATVSGQILDDHGNPVEGAAVHLSGTQNRLAITDADGKYHFDEVETNGFYVVTPARANFTFSPAQRSFSQLGATTEATFTASATGGTLNPLDTTEYFVRQQYLDFLGREPDNAGFNFWVNNIESCGNNLGCREVKRIDTSAAFFLSIESQQTGYFVYRAYQVAYGDLPNTPVPVRLSEFRTDAALVSKDVVVLRDGWQRTLENNKRLFAEDFVKRSRFVTAYPTSMSPAEFVDRLFATAGIPQTDGDYSAALGEFGRSADTVDTGARARVLQRLAENQFLSRREFNQAFVLMEYFGYLRRDPNSGQDTDFGGYNFWLDKLDRFHGNFQDAEMVKAFLTSIEYRARFPR